MSTLFKFFSLTYYTPVILIIESFIILYLSLKYKHRLRILRLFPFYALASLLQNLLIIYCIIFKPYYSNTISSYSIYCFILIEFSIFYHFMFSLLQKSKKKSILYLLLLIFFISAIDAEREINLSLEIPISFYLINSTCLLLPCIFYIYEIFKTLPLVSLSNQPAFWIVTGILFLVTGTLPFFLLEKYVYKYISDYYDQICALNYVFYCLLFSLIIKAYLCIAETAKY